MSVSTLLPRVICGSLRVDESPPDSIPSPERDIPGGAGTGNLPDDLDDTRLAGARGDSPRGVRIDVEYAHQCAIPSVTCRTEEEIETSRTVAASLIAGLRGRDGLGIATSVLIDDKKNRSSEIDVRAKEAVERCQSELGVDRVMLESRLDEHRHRYYASLPAGSPLPGRFERRRELYGELACSQDVAIWQALRLGLYRPSMNTWSLGDDGEPADVCVTVLPWRFQKYEAKAYDQGLRHHLRAAPRREGSRIRLTGTHGDRDVLLWTIWVDTSCSPADLTSLGETEARAILTHLPQLDPCLTRTGELA